MNEVGCLLAILVALAAVIPSSALAGRCEELARPALFNGDTAMEAVFCQYDRGHGGTLLPLAATRGWRLERAEQLATPILAETYVEGGVRKGVLVVARQPLVGGEVADSHGTTVDLSVYVFRRAPDHWVYEKGSKTLASDGSWGSPPGVRLVRLGEASFGLWWESGWTGQGYSMGTISIASLSQGVPEVLGRFETGQSHAGACEAAVREGPCWEYRGRVEFLRIGAGGHWIVRHSLSGTKQDPPSRVMPVDSTTCHRVVGSRYAEAVVDGCAEAPPVPERELFGAGLGVEGGKAGRAPR